MNIIEATKAAQKKSACIKRADWNDTAVIRPTDIGYDLLYRTTEKKRPPMWNPKTEDVLADDWTICN